jgi:prepilin-type N-terminal cleavage/methylation domain-containing protein
MPGRAGYSLTEILVALAIFSIATLALTSGVTTVLRAGDVSARLTQATVLAQDKIEVLRASGAPPAGGSDTPVAGFSRSWAVAPDAPEPGVTQITVTVAWTDYGPHTISLSTVVND